MPDSLASRVSVGPLPKNLRPEASEALRLADARVLRVLEALGGSYVCVLRVLESLGGSFVRVVRVREAPGGPGSNGLKNPGGSAKEGPHACGGRGGLWEAHLYVFYVSGRLSASGSNQPCRPCEIMLVRKRKTLTGVGGGGGGRRSICRVLRGSEALGGSFVCVLRVGEVLGGLRF